MLGQPPVGRDLAAEHREQRRGAVGRIDLEMVVARHRGRIVVAVVEQRPHAGIGPDDVLRPHRLGHVVAGQLAEIGDFLGRADRRLARLDSDVGGADQREVPLVGNDEDDAVVLVLQHEGMIAVMQARHDDVAALDQADPLGRLDVRLLVEEALHPGPGRIDQAARAERHRRSVRRG